MISKIFYFLLYCVRLFIYGCFWIILIFFAPFILFFGFIFSQELFDYLNEIVIKIDEMAQKVLEENKKKFREDKLISFSKKD